MCGLFLFTNCQSNNCNYSSPIHESKSEHRKPKQPMLEAVHEISIYIHGSNLDLFQQGWYQIKITIRWEDGDNGSLGTPSRILNMK
ncbi:hypothetical protein HAX54_028071 [Datura stramonium]|uniref:Uncharacterized protein n=1 Tax=Datura stramonium TaxID=4076 RepID=A0ABS8S9A6_DATST|nr:hypothetical protein [Datura stramonium]